MKRQQKMFTLTLAPSYALLFLYGLLALFTSGCLFFLPVSKLLIGFFIGMVCLLCLRAVLQHALLVRPNSWVSLTRNAKNQWHATNQQGDVVPVIIAPNTVVTPYLTVVNMQRLNNKKLGSLLLIPSRVDAESYRQLRVMLLWGNVSDQGVTDSVDALEKSI